MSATKRSVTIYGFNMRDNVPIETPNEPLVKILERFCAKNKINPKNYTLKYRSKYLDLSSPWRLSGVAAGAQLELVSAKAKKGSLVVALQTDSGRIKVNASIDASLMGLLISAEKQTGHNFVRRKDEKRLYLMPSIVYLNNEYNSLETLRNTTLRSMGITPGSNCMMRLSYKNTLTTFESISSSLDQMVAEVSEEESQLTTAPPTKRPRSSQTQPESSSNPNNKTSNKQHEESNPEPLIQLAENDNHEQNTDQKDTSMEITESLDSSSSSEVKESDESSSSNENKPWENVQVLMPKSKQERWEITPDMFEITPEEYRRMQEEHSARREIDNTLMTKEMRERKKRKHNRKYIKTFVRIRFPDGYMLQATFKPTHRLHVVRRLIKDCLSNPDLNFYLYTTPPKQKFTDETQSLKGLGLVPAAVINIAQTSGDEKPKIKQQLLQSVEQLDQQDISESMAPEDRPNKPASSSQKSKEKKKSSMSKERKENRLKKLLFSKK